MRSMQTLKTLTLRGGIRAILSSRSFLHMARLPALTSLDLPYVDLTWVEGLEGRSDGLIFPKLQAFRVGLFDFGPQFGISDEALALLLPRLHTITELRIKSTRNVDSNKAFHIVARSQLSALERVEIKHNPEAVVRGTDLLALADLAPGLKELKVPFYVDNLDGTGASLGAEGITDDVITGFASRLPNLEVLDLADELCPVVDVVMVVDNYHLTSASLLSLGRHCRRLTRCSLIAAVAFGSALRIATPELFPKLLHLDIHQGLDQEDFELYGTVDQLARRMMEVAPLLSRFCVHSLHNADVALNRAVRRQIGDRWTGQHELHFTH